MDQSNTNAGVVPDAVTLMPGDSALELLANIDRSPGCSIKDSFASLDLTRHGLRVLFDAQWIVRTPSRTQAPPTSPRWAVVEDVETFSRWEEAGHGPDGPQDVLRPGLLGLNAVTLLAAQTDARIVGGAVLDRRATVVGVSNFFSEDPAGSANWSGCLALADALFPGATLVGYESGDALETAQTLGFRPVGPLRVLDPP